MLLIVFIVQRCFGVPRPVLLFYPMLLATHTQADWNWLLKEIAELEKSAQQQNLERLRRQLQPIVPEYAAAPSPSAAYLDTGLDYCDRRGEPGGIGFQSPISRIATAGE